MTNRPRPLGPDEQTYTNSIIGIDTSHGGNVGKADAHSRWIADQFPLQRVELPPAYTDPIAEKIRDGSATAEEKQEYIEKYGLTDNQATLESTFGDATPLRRQFMTNMGQCLDLMGKMALADTRKDTSIMPSFEERWIASTGRAPELADTATLREQLRANLAATGIETGNGKSLREAVEEWENRIGLVSPDQFLSELRRRLQETLKLTQEKIFPHLPEEIQAELARINLLNINASTFHEPDHHASGSNLYVGGINASGDRTFLSNLELNTGHPPTTLGMLTLAAHEGIPGHHLDSALSDIMWTRGDLGIEAVTSTMCSREVALREGLAQNTLAILYGSKQNAIETLGPDLAVQLTLDRLVDAAKNDGPILMHHTPYTLEEDAVRERLANHHVLSSIMINKIIAWATHPLIGSMYAGTYLRGSTSVEAAIQEHGPEKIIQLCYHQHGYHDITTFEMALAA